MLSGQAEQIPFQATEFKNSAISSTPTLIVTFGELFGENYIYQHQQPWKENKVRTYIPGVNNAYNPITGAGEAPLYVRGMQTIHYDDELYDVGFRSVGRSVKRLDEAGVTKLADLIVLDRDPLSDIRNTNSVRYTMVNGRLYDADSMNEIGNYNRPRTKFFWELGERHGVDWSPAWAGGGG